MVRWPAQKTPQKLRIAQPYLEVQFDDRSLTQFPLLDSDNRVGLPTQRDPDGAASPKPIGEPGRSDIITGCVLVAVGVASIGAGVGTFYAPAGNHDFTNIIIGGLLNIAGVAVITPGVIIASIGGYKKWRASQPTAMYNKLPSVSLSPYVSTQGAGLLVLGRF